MKRLAAICLAALAAVLLFSACSGKQTSASAPTGVTEEQLPGLLEELMPKAADLTAVFTGGGLTADWNKSLPLNDKGQQFAPVTDSAYHSTQELRDAVEAVFTPEYAEQNFYQYGLEGDRPRYADIDGVLYIDGMQGGGGYSTYDVSTMQVTEKTDDSFTVEMEFQSAYGSKGNAKIVLKVVDDGVRIDALEYLN